MIPTRTLAVSSLLCAVACTGGSPTVPPEDRRPDRPAAPNEQVAATLGMTILSSDASGAPRLMRSIVPRAHAAGMTPQAAARDHVSALAPLWVRQATPMALIDTGTQRLRNGAKVVRLTQQVDGVVVHQGELRVLMHPDGSLAAVSGTLLPSTGTPSFVSSPREALDRALDQLHGKARARPLISEVGDRAGWQQLSVAASPRLRVTQARARRELARVADQLVPVWAVEVFGDAAVGPTRDPGITEPAAHRYLVGDADGRIVRDTDLIHRDAYVYRAYAEPTGNRRPLDGALQSFAPHPTGFPDGSKPDFAASNLVAIDSFNQTFDPWLASNATTTSGNNVDAFSDFDGSLDESEGDIRPRVTAGRILSYRYDPVAEPSASPEQSHAGTVNAFFVTNWMHDWWYDSGFTEATGNAQVDNYGRGGVDGDPLIVLAQFGAAASRRDNAFMVTPFDGASPRMFVLLWSAGADTSLTAPHGVVQSAALLAGPRAFDLTAEVVAADDGFAPGNDGCDPITNDVAGKIALVTNSGQCGSDTMVANLGAAGAAGVILVDDVFEVPGLFGGSARANVPGVVIGKTDGAALRSALAAGPVTVALHSVRLGPERDGDLDNTLIAHEWGHYLHHRLASCELGLQCSGMSEGWADFNALLLMLRDGDNREGTYAMSPYGTANGTFDAAYFGIRRFPYSTDRTRNALSLRHIGDGAELPTGPRGRFGTRGPNSELHNTGEVWASMLWEAFHVLIDAYDVRTARRRMSDYAVAGLLLTPPEATFTEARDAILAAASALDSDDMLLIAAAFAGRGAGSCAVSPSHDSRDNTGVVESGTLAARLEVGSLSVRDDGASCDHDGYLDPGESGTLRATVANAGPVAAEEVTATATASVPGVKLGAPIRLGTVLPFTSVELRIPVTVLASAPRNHSVAITLRVAGQGGCERNAISVGLNPVIGVDEAAAVSRVDHVETVLTPWTPTGDGAGALWSRVADAGGNHSWFARNAGFRSDTQLVSPVLIASATAPFVVKIAHAYNLDAFEELLFDGAVIEVSTDGGATWTDVSELGVDPGYTGRIISFGNPLFERLAFGGMSAGFPARRPLVLDFGTRLAGQSVQLRFRIGTDDSFAISGWDVDEIEVSGIDNTPFPALVPEPSVCTAKSAELGDSVVFTTHTAPATSLRPIDAACVAADPP